MKALTNFIATTTKKIKPILVLVPPVHGKHSWGEPEVVSEIPTHGSHARPRPVVVTAQPVHGSHSYPPDDIQESLNQINDWLSSHENGHLGVSEDDVQNALHEHYNIEALGEGHKEHLLRYAGGSRSLNERLIHSSKTSDPERDIKEAGWSKRVQGLDEVLGKHKTPNSMTVYHGAGFDPEDYVNQHPEGLLKIPTYLSTSISKSKGLDFAKELRNYRGFDHRNILKINVPENHPGFFIGKHGIFDDEKEFLMPRNTVLRVDKNPLNIDTRHSSYKIWSAMPI